MKCAECKFWDRHTSGRDDAGVGFCRINPPELCEEVKGAWPITDHDDWCGEFEAKPNPEMERILREENGKDRQAMIDFLMGK